MTPCFFVIPHGIYTPFCRVENTLQLVVELLVPLVRSLVAAVTASLFVHALRTQHQSSHQQTELPSGFWRLLATALGSFDLYEFFFEFIFDLCLQQAVAKLFPSDGLSMFFSDFFLSLISSFSATFCLSWQKLRAQKASFRSIFTTAVFNFDLTEFLFSCFVERCFSLLFPFAILYVFEFFPIPLLL